MSQILELTMTERVCDSDALRCAAFDCAERAGEQSACLVQVHTADAGTVLVMVNVGAGEASAVLPLPTREETIGWAERFDFPAGTFLISERPCAETLKQAQTALPEAKRIFALSLDRETARFETLLHDRETGETRPVRRTAEGAAAAAMLLHRELQDGTMEITVGQPGGILEIGLRKEAGRVLGLSAGGPVRMEGEP